MEFLIAGLLVLNLAVTFVSARLLAREARRHACEGKELLAEAKRSLTEVNASQAALTHKLTETEERRRSDAEARREALSGLCDAVQRLTALAREIQAGAEEETRISRSMEEGFSNIMGYSVGKGAGEEVKL